MNLKLLGLSVGFISAALGVGGGAILVPALMSFFHFDFRRAASTSLATIIPISLVGAVCHILLSRYGLHLSLFLHFIPFCILGSICAGLFIKRYKPPWLKLAFAIFILVSGLKMLNICDMSFFLFDSLKGISAGNQAISVAIFGIATGAIATMLGVGCGLIIVPFFVIVTGLGMHETITLSLATMFFMTTTATLVHKKHKALDQQSVVSMLLPALVGAILGTLVSGHLPASSLKKLFGVFLLLMSFNFLIGERLTAIIKARREVKYGLQNVRSNL